MAQQTEQLWDICCFVLCIPNLKLHLFLALTFTLSIQLRCLSVTELKAQSRTDVGLHEGGI